MAFKSPDLHRLETHASPDSALKVPEPFSRDCAALCAFGLDPEDLSITGCKDFLMRAVAEAEQ